MSTIPEGFAPHFRKSPLTEPWEPLFSRVRNGAVEIGLRAAAPHTNSRGLVHGGLISALADNAMGLSCGAKLQAGAGLVTVSLSVDFLGMAKIGQWLCVEPDFLKTGRRIAFAQCFVTADGAPVARASASFAVSVQDEARTEA